MTAASNINNYIKQLLISTLLLATSQHGKVIISADVSESKSYSCGDACVAAPVSRLAVLLCHCQESSDASPPDTQHPLHSLDLPDVEAINNLHSDFKLLRYLSGMLASSKPSVSGGLSKRQDKYFDYGLEMPWFEEYKNGGPAAEESNKKVFRYGKR